MSRYQGTYTIILPQSVHGPWACPSDDGGGVLGAGFGGAKGTCVLTAGWGFAGTEGGILEGLKMGDVVPAPGVGDFTGKENYIQNIPYRRRI